MNLTRGEPFEIDVGFDCGVELLRDFTLSIAQGGRVLLKRGMRDALIGGEGRCASLCFPGGETARLRPCDPAYAQVRAVLMTGDELYSGAEEINIVDTLGGWEERE